MTRTALRAGAAALALIVMAESVLARSENDPRPRKVSIFEEIFGSAPRKPAADSRKKKRTLFGSDWFDDGRKIRIINGQDASSAARGKNRPTPNVIVADDDPEGESGFGMGNLTYVADRTVPMVMVGARTERPEEPAAAAIHDALTASESPLRVVPTIRDAVAAHYAANGFRPLWTRDGDLTERGKALRDVLAAADAEGLERAAYLPPALGAFEAAPPGHDTAAMARLDIELSALALKYARDASGGRFEPERLSRYHDVRPPRVEASLAMRVLAFSPFPDSYLRSLHPVHPAYEALKAELASLRNTASAAPGEPIAEGPLVKTGKADARVPAVRQRLADLGYPQALDAAGDPEVLDADLSIQLRLFQKASGIKVSGFLGPQTVAALNTPARETNIARILNNLERLRWLPRDLGKRHVFVNQAAFELQVIEDRRPVWTSRVIVGKPHTQTVVFHDQMEMIVFNPSWGVPPSIVANEYLPKLRNDPGYLDRIGFRVVDSRGRIVPSGTVNWAAYGSKVPFGIQQPPGRDNALGDVKFLFPNSHNIYMHDTPNRNLFEKDVRAFSHGCVRVENPRDFAAILLGWDRERIEAHIATPKSETVRLERRIPVHLTYFTAWPDDTGKIRYFNDIYGRDKAMDNARAGLVVAQR